MGIVTGQALPSLKGIVAGAAGNRLHQLSMAIGAERGAGFIEKLLFVRAVRAVARGAVADENRLMNRFLDELRFRIGVTAVADLVGPIFEDRRKIGTMGVMAGGAVPLRERLMPGFYVIRRLHLRVAGIAKIPALRGEKPLVGCRMGEMAGHAPFSLRYRRMGFRNRLPHFSVALKAEAVSFLGKKTRVLRRMRAVAGEALPSLEGIMQDRTCGLHLGFVVALVAERAALFRRREGRLRGRRGMARIAAFLDHGIVSACLQKFCLGRGVWIVATRTGGRFYGVISMRLLESSLAGIMAGEAKGGLCVHEQIVFVGAVGVMADPAPLLLENRMNDLLLIGVFRMALIAGLRAFCLEEMSPAGGVRVVAGGAFAGLQRGMHLGLVQPDLFFCVAGEAKVVPVFFQQELRDDPVP